MAPMLKLEWLEAFVLRRPGTRSTGAAERLATTLLAAGAAWKAEG
jgi:hypothetical protein